MLRKEQMTYKAAPQVVVGAERVGRFLVGTNKKGGGTITRINRFISNGLPSLVVDGSSDDAKLAPRVLVQVELNEKGLIRRLYLVLAPSKLTALGEVKS